MHSKFFTLVTKSQAKSWTTAADITQLPANAIKLKTVNSLSTSQYLHFTYHNIQNQIQWTRSFSMPLFVEQSLSEYQIMQKTGMHDCDFPTMEDIEISERGVTTLLQNLNPHKACSPEGIRPHVLKELARDCTCTDCSF